jgi:hypothetical protein
VTRTWSAAPVSLLLAAIAGMSLWRTLDATTLLMGVACGLVGGGVAAVVLTTRSWPLVLRLAVALLVAGCTLTAAARSLSAIVDFPQLVATFLTVGHPAAGLSTLAVIPAAITFVTAAVTLTVGLSGRQSTSLLLSIVGIGLAAIVAGPTGVPLLAPLLTAGLIGLGLMLCARRDFTELAPLVGSSTALKRQLRWWQPTVILLPALLLATVGAVVPHRPPIDLASFVDIPEEVYADDNPLSVVSRLIGSPPAEADWEYRVTVIGPSPGRLRLAVLDDYQLDGWSQLDGFSLTGQALARPDFSTGTTQAATTVEVVRNVDNNDSTFRALPSAGSPISVDDPQQVRYAVDAGVLLHDGASAADRPERLVYRTHPYRVDPLVEEEPPTASMPVVYTSCPQELARVREVADVVTGGAATSLGKVKEIENYLKTLRVYVPTWDGGQSFGNRGPGDLGVEAFIGRDLAYGNLEVFTTAFALLLRCSGVPSRVVIGFPSPAADGETTFSGNDLIAWVEVPFATSGWVPFDPIPTPEQQRQQAEVLKQDSKSVPDDKEITDTSTPSRVIEEADASSIWATVLGVIAGVVVVLGVWVLVIPPIVRGRRRRFARPDRAVHAAWATVTDRLVDRGFALGSHLTPNEVARATSGRVSYSATRLITDLARREDHARFDRDTLTDEEVGTSWALADAACTLLRHDWKSRLTPVRHPIRVWRRLRSTFGVRSRRRPWQGTVPPESLVASGDVKVEVSGFSVDAVLGAGSSATVYRGLRDTDQMPVAIKVFAYPIGASTIHQQRFRWEANIAELVSGRPNLPEFLGSGLTVSGQPYLITKLYERGTLFRRVQRAGALSQGEVLSIGQAIALALETLHQNTILHGDVKPENIFIADDGTHVLGDLGAAWLRADGGPARAITPPYAAPEVWLGNAPSKQSDIYSLGLTLMFAATGRPPIAGLPVPRSEVEAAMGSDILMPLLEVDPRRRPKSALDVARILGAPVDHATTTASVFALPTPTVHFSSPAAASTSQVAATEAKTSRQQRRVPRRKP